MPKVKDNRLGSARSLKERISTSNGTNAGEVASIFSSIYNETCAGSSNLDRSFFVTFLNIYLVACGWRPAAIVDIPIGSNLDHAVSRLNGAFEDFRLNIDILKERYNSSTGRTTHIRVLASNPSVVNASSQLRKDLAHILANKDNNNNNNNVINQERRLLGYKCKDGFPCNGNTFVDHTVTLTPETRPPMKSILYTYCCTDHEMIRVEMKGADVMNTYLQELDLNGIAHMRASIDTFKPRA